MSDNLSCQIYRVFIRATPEEIWEAITTPSFTTRYFHGAAIEVRGNRVTSHGPDGSTWVMPRSSRRTARTGSPTVGSPSTTPRWRRKPRAGSPGRSKSVTAASACCRSPTTSSRVRRRPRKVSRGPLDVRVERLKTLLETGQPLLQSESGAVIGVELQGCRAWLHRHACPHRLAPARERLDAPFIGERLDDPKASP